MTFGRVRERRAFQRLARDGVGIRTDTLWCRYVSDPAIVPPQVAFAIGRSLGPAVQRNRLRRRLREAVRAVAGSPSLPHGVLLLGARPAATKQTFESLCGELSVMLADLGRSANGAHP